jgi:hypothetical protein
MIYGLYYRDFAPGETQTASARAATGPQLHASATQAIARVAAEALPPMRLEGEYYVEEWGHFFWRRGRLDIAARLLGAVDAKRARSGFPPQPNERRLLGQVGPAIDAAMPPDVLAGHRAAGAALDNAGVHALIVDGLA